MKKTVSCAGIVILCMSVWMMGGCANDGADNGQHAALLLGINSMTEEETAFSIVTAIPSAQDAAGGSGERSSVLSTKEMIAVINKKASSAFLRSELGAPGARTSISFVSDETCESGICYTLSGTGNCLNSGTMTLNDMKMSLEMVSDGDTLNMTGLVNGSTTYSNCGGKARNWLNYPDYENVIIDGTLAQYDETEIVSLLIAGDILSGSYTMSSTQKGSRTVTAGSISVNGMNFTDVTLNCVTDLMQYSQVSNHSYKTEGNIITYSADYVETITGKVSVDGTLGPDNDIVAERIFNTETFRYHSSCTMDADNFSISCSVSRI